MNEYKEAKLNSRAGSKDSAAIANIILKTGGQQSSQSRQ